MCFDVFESGVYDTRIVGLVATPIFDAGTLTVNVPALVTVVLTFAFPIFRTTAPLTLSAPVGLTFTLIDTVPVIFFVPVGTLTESFESIFGTEAVRDDLVFAVVYPARVPVTVTVIFLPMNDAVSLRLDLVAPLMAFESRSPCRRTI